MATILGSNITTVAALDAAIAQANAETTAGAYEIDLGANATIALTQALTAISLHSGVTLDIEGNDATINGESEQQGLVVQDGAVTVENLTIEYCAGGRRRGRRWRRWRRGPARRRPFRRRDRQCRADGCVLF